MKKLSKILVLLILAALLFSCSGSGGGSGLSNLFNNNSSHNYSLSGRNFGNQQANEYFRFTDDTHVTHTYSGTDHAGTYTNQTSKTGTLTITYTDTTIPNFSKAYTFAEDGHSFHFNDAPTITFSMY